MSYNQQLQIFFTPMEHKQKPDNGLTVKNSPKDISVKAMLDFICELGYVKAKLFPCSQSQAWCPGHQQKR